MKSGLFLEKYRLVEEAACNQRCKSLSWQCILTPQGLKDMAVTRPFYAQNQEKNLAQPKGLFSVVFSSSPSMVQFDTLLTGQLMHGSLGFRSKHSRIFFFKAICIFRHYLVEILAGLPQIVSN